MKKKMKINFIIEKNKHFFIENFFSNYFPLSDKLAV